jgi:hypothetical protein
METERRPSDRRLVLVVSIILLIPALYLASIGPACGLFDRGFISAETYTAYLMPFQYTLGRIPTIVYAFEAYSLLFRQ